MIWRSRSGVTSSNSKAPVLQLIPEASRGAERLNRARETSPNPAWAAYKSDEFALKIISTNMMKKHHAHFTIRPEGELMLQPTNWVGG